MLYSYAIYDNDTEELLKRNYGFQTKSFVLYTVHDLMSQQRFRNARAVIQSEDHSQMQTIVNKPRRKKAA